MGLAMDQFRAAGFALMLELSGLEEGNDGVLAFVTLHGLFFTIDGGATFTVASAHAHGAVDPHRLALGTHDDGVGLRFFFILGCL